MKITQLKKGQKFVFTDSKINPPIIYTFDKIKGNYYYYFGGGGSYNSPIKANYNVKLK